MREHHAACPDGSERRAIRNDPHADRGSRVVPRTADNGNPGDQTAFRRGRFRQHAGHIGRFIDLAEHIRTNGQRVAHHIRPDAHRHIEQLHTGRVRDLCGVFSGQKQAHIVLRQENLSAFLENLRLMLLHPADFSGGKTRQHRICRDRHASLSSDLRFDLRAFRAGSLIAPEDRRT